MKQSLNQLKLLFSSATDAIDNPPSILQSLALGAVILIISFLFLLSNSLSANTLSISLFPNLDLSFTALFLFVILTQIICIGIPIFFAFGVTGLKSYARNFALIQLPGLGLVLIGFFYQEIFWALYKILPLKGLTANAIYEATLLVYPALILVLFRYILLWMITSRQNKSPLRMVIFVSSHLVLSALVWIAGGLLI